eukprot:TRINITY_DN3663_c0_g1_i1.p1 TRINITY_DN3663_c0_g1~~TRINITY_DN3663_c0_g1_i1.p1  ORF type:complete len:149 (+),score=4.85 TRINITY_DN3663_c0_g1_i1:130-576(+)
MDTLETPFHFLRVPNLKLKFPSLSTLTPSSMTLFVLVFLSYFLVSSGIIYDVIVEPPSIGSSREGEGVKPIAFLKYRINGQYIIEGLSGGFLFIVGALGFILLDKANQRSTSERNRYLILLAGVICILAAYNLCIVFLREKLPGYQRS